MKSDLQHLADEATLGPTKNRRDGLSREAFAALFAASRHQERRRLILLMDLQDIAVCEAILQVEMQRIDGHAQH